MKKILTALCAASLALGLGVTALAAPEGEANFALGAKGGPAIIVSPNTYYNLNGLANTPIQAFNNNVNDRWQPADGSIDLNEDRTLKTECYIGLDFGPEGVDFDKITLEWESAQPDNSAAGYTLQYSADGQQWQDISATINYGATEGDGTDHRKDVATFTKVEDARYVRVLIKKMFGTKHGNPSLYEFQIFDTTVGETEDDNLALVVNDTVYTVSTVDGSAQPANAFDGSASTGWKLNAEASQDPSGAWLLKKDEYIGVRFSELKTVGYVTMTWPNNYNPKRRSEAPNAYVLQITKDGVTWENVEASYAATYTETQPEKDGDYIYTVSFNETAVLGVRVSIHEMGNKNYPQLNSFEVYQNADSVISKYNVKVDSTITGGAVLAPTTMFEEGDTVEVTVIPDQGYQLKAGSLKANDVEITEKDGVYSFTMPGEAVTITAEFEKISSEDPVYQIEIEETTGGKIAVDKTEGPWGTEIIVTVTPDEGLELKELRANGTLIRPTDGVYTFHMPASNVTLTAVFGEPGVDPDPDNPGGEDPDNPGGEDPDNPDVPGTGVASVTAIVLLAGGSAAGVAISKKRNKK